MDCARQWNGIIFQVFYCRGKGAAVFALYIDIFIARNNPFYPTVWSFRVIPAFYSGKVKAFSEIFPRLE